MRPIACMHGGRSPLFNFDLTPHHCRRRGGLQQQGAGVPGSMFAMGGAAGIVGGGGIMSPAGGFGGSLPQGGGGSTPVFGKLGKRLD